MSMYCQDLIYSDGGEVLLVMDGHENFALASLTAESVRSRSQTVHGDPLPEEDSHVLICGPKPESTRRWLAVNAVWRIEPSPPVSSDH